MMKSRKIKTSFVLTILVVSFPVMAIQDSTANNLSAVVAVVAAASSYKINKAFPRDAHGAVLVAATCLTTAVAYCLFHRSTPRGRLKRAHVLLNELGRHTLTKTSFETDRAFFDVVQDVYLTDDLPLISAYNHLISLVPTLHYAFSLTNKASAQAGRDVLLQEECDVCFCRANKFFKNTSDAIKRIKEHKDYLSQLNIYKEGLLYAKQTIAQEQMALAQLQMAHAQQSSSFLKWLKAICWGK